MKPRTPTEFTTETQSTRRPEAESFIRLSYRCRPPFTRAPIQRFSQKITNATKRGVEQTTKNLICLRELMLSPRKSLFPSLRVLCVSVVNFAFVAFAQADGPITLWYQRGGNPDQQRILQKDLVEPSNAAHPKTPLTLDVLASGTGDKKIRMAVISGKGPDIVMTPGPSTTLALVQSGHLLPLDDYIKKYNLDKRILTPVLRTGEYQGHNYALPRTFETMVLYYNKTLFDKNSWAPPKTMADLNTLAEAAHGERDHSVFSRER
jgi:Bacterial extracellular solute-binding protein